MQRRRNAALVKVYPVNGERVLSLLCIREALGKPQARQKYRQGGGFNEQQKGVGQSLTEGFGVPAVLQKHILSRCFIAGAERR